MKKADCGFFPASRHIEGTDRFIENPLCVTEPRLGNPAIAIAGGFRRRRRALRQSDYPLERERSVGQSFCSIRTVRQFPGGAATRSNPFRLPLHFRRAVATISQMTYPCRDRRDLKCPPTPWRQAKGAGEGNWRVRLRSLTTAQRYPHTSRQADADSAGSPYHVNHIESE